MTYVSVILGSLLLFGDIVSSPPKQASFGTTKPEEDQDQKCEESFEDLQAKLKQLEETMQSIDCP